ncbi:hypothetical protein LA6_001395 [Marinibacterium anthonyi]|nr:hypothetical protein LA6_001395 [Marinibacterium anthonyi]|tara:strand:+ start:560 stop:703 length:144 start_codon:yes stop_codon:yes gene_type:complete
MFKSIKLLALAGVIGTTLSACAKDEPEVVYVQPEPVSTEPTYTGKYK